ncbi:MAG: ChrR family anti-sigma-E factor [Parvularculaceae bacterium]
MRTEIEHHARTETLASYAAGALDEARSVVVATHITRCPTCREAVRDFESLGGAMLENIEPAPMSAGSLASLWEMAGEQIDAPAGPVSPAANDLDLEAAKPLRAYLNSSLDDIEWRPFAPGVSQHILEAEGYRKGVLRLIKIQPGTRLVRHTHRDEEVTLILRGAYEDEIGEFRAGDLADLDDGVVHSPRAVGDEPCICVIATNAPLVFKGVVGKVLQPFVRM